MDDIRTQIRSKSYMQFEKNKAWEKFNKARLDLSNALKVTSAKKEEELTKEDLLKLIQLNCAYMFAYNSYNYWKEQLERYVVGNK